MIKLVYFATAEIALDSFRALVENPNFEVLSFVTQPTRPSGRGKKLIDSEIKTYAKENNIQVLETEKISIDNDLINKLKDFNPDFFVTFAFGQILSQEVLDIPLFGTVNIHASLLPKYRGSNPIREALLMGDSKTGVTTMLTELELDSGAICMQDAIELDTNINSIELTEKISKISPDLIQKTLMGLYSKTLTPQAQEHSLATFTKKTKKEDKIIDWKLDAIKIHNKVRALVDNFTCQSVLNGKIIKIIKTNVVDTSANAGEIIEINKKGVLVGAGANSLLLEIVKPEGKGEMSAYNWSLGARLKIGDRFEN